MTQHFVAKVNFSLFIRHRKSAGGVITTGLEESDDPNANTVNVNLTLRLSLRN